MFWRKKTDGFEWHKYVRTTIKLRREDRQQRLGAVKNAAIDGLKDVGRAGIAGSFDWLDRFNGALAAPFAGLGRGIASAFGFGARLLERPLTPVADVVARQGVGSLLALLAVVAGLLGIGRSSVAGWDRVALAELGVALVLAAVLILPPLVTGRGVPMLATLPERLAHVARRIPGAALLSPATFRAATVAALGCLLMGGGWLAVRAVASLPLGSLSGFALPGSIQAGIDGRATAVAGDRLRVGSRIVRLAGIDAPESEQTCGGQGREKRWKCGAAAQTALAEMVRGKTVHCDVGEAGEDGTATGTCTIDSRDIAAELVAHGQVFSAAALFSGYGRLEQDARNAKLGLWRGTVERPAEYRARLWEQARKSAPDGCPIKGHVAGGAKHYVVPWQPSYRNVKVDAQRGGRWFCSEEEAQAAGWKPVERS